MCFYDMPPYQPSMVLLVIFVKHKAEMQLPCAIKVAYFPKFCYCRAFHDVATVAPAHRFVGPPCGVHRPSKIAAASTDTMSTDKLMKIGLQHFETIAENELY